MVKEGGARASAVAAGGGGGRLDATTSVGAGVGDTSSDSGSEDDASAGAGGPGRNVRDVILLVCMHTPCESTCRVNFTVNESGARTMYRVRVNMMMNRLSVKFLGPLLFFPP